MGTNTRPHGDVREGGEWRTDVRDDVSEDQADG